MNQRVASSLDRRIACALGFCSVLPCAHAESNLSTCYWRSFSCLNSSSPIRCSKKTSSRACSSVACQFSEISKTRFWSGVEFSGRYAESKSAISRSLRNSRIFFLRSSRVGSISCRYFSHPFPTSFPHSFGEPATGNPVERFSLWRMLVHTRSISASMSWEDDSRTAICVLIASVRLRSFPSVSKSMCSFCACATWRSMSSRCRISARPAKYRARAVARFPKNAVAFPTSASVARFQSRLLAVWATHAIHPTARMANIAAEQFVIEKQRGILMWFGSPGLPHLAVRFSVCSTLRGQTQTTERLCD
ncbi:hypothetical protein BURC_03715 [Burkholderiaceae bacterium]|nr:hypothetical protein BURC_03715 [Burkholderiaceae bacterium]